MQRPALFSGLGDVFIGRLANVDIVFSVNGVAQAPVRGIFRQFREADLMEFQSPAIEGVTHKLAVAAAAVPVGFDPDADTLSIGAGSYSVNTMEDDGRAMVRLLLRGDNA